MKTNADKLSVVTTIFPEYDWVMNILGDTAENAEVKGSDFSFTYKTTCDALLNVCIFLIFGKI